MGPVIGSAVHRKGHQRDGEREGDSNRIVGSDMQRGMQGGRSHCTQGAIVFQYDDHKQTVPNAVYITANRLTV